ncbi:Zn finger protein [Sorochytrium milnesiophthora]
MDVYEATRKKRQQHPTLAPLPSQAKTAASAPGEQQPQHYATDRVKGAADSRRPPIPSSLSMNAMSRHRPQSSMDGKSDISLASSTGSGSVGPAKHRLLRSVSESLLRTETTADGAAAGEVGHPTRAHWRADNEVSACTSCSRLFSLFERRHHCRRCGNIFCKACSSNTARLDALANFSEHGHLVRVCDGCLQEEVSVKADQTKLEVERLRQQRVALERERERKRRREAERESRGGAAGAGNPTSSVASLDSSAAQSIDIKQPAQNLPAQAESMGVGTLGSVPSDWNWSTF